MATLHAALVVTALGLAAAARAQTPPAAPGAPAAQISELIVTASREDLLGKAVTASQGVVTAQELKLRPAYRVGQLLESVPGLVVTVHSGEGKANQYLARGFNLDHGTDIANFIDDTPINRSTNAHGQGYSDLNFIVPEVLDGLQYTKGPYFPSLGDFGAVASVHLDIADVLADQMSASADTFGGYEGFVGGTQTLGPDDRLMGAFEGSKVNGPFDPSNDFRKIASVARYSHGDGANGYDLTVQYYHGFGNLDTDQPERAVAEGLIGEFGSLDPSDGNRSERLSASGHYDLARDGWAFTSNAYFVRSRMTLWNDFTHFLEDPVNGDQEQQDESRDLAGGGAALERESKLGTIDRQTTIGVQARYDDLFVDRRHTRHRVVLDYCERLQPDGITAVKYNMGLPFCSADRVQLHDIGVYLENDTHWTDWLRTDIGAREEIYGGSDLSLVPGGVHSTAPYVQDLTLFQPKGNLVLGPWAKTELYVSAGRGFHSDDIRGVSGTVPLEGIPAIAGPTPLLVQADGEEVGIRTDIIPRTHIQIALFNLHLASELVYDQDQGEDQAGPPSDRDGVEFSAEYRPFPWLELNTDLSFSHARFVDVTPAMLLNDYGQAGNYIPNAPHFIGSAGALVDNLGRWYGGLQIRILGSYPLVSDNSVTDAGYTETNIDIGYKISRSLEAEIEVFNLFDVKANAGAYYYTTVIPDGLGPTADHQFHPLEPLSGRFVVTAFF